MRKHAWFTFHQDRPAVKNRHRLGGVHLMWASHFPFEDSNWPDNRQQAMRVTDEVPPERPPGATGRQRRPPLPVARDTRRASPTTRSRAFEQLVHF